MIATTQEYHHRRLAGEFGAHVAEVKQPSGPTLYIARTNVWEGPGRFDPMAARADLLDRLDAGR